MFQELLQKQFQILIFQQLLNYGKVVVIELQRKFEKT